MDQAAEGKRFLLNSQYDEAIRAYTEALKTSPTSPDYLIQRSTAFQRAKRYAEALADAELAVVNGQKRAKREAIVQAQMRRGVALYNLGRYGDAKFTFEIVKRMDQQEKSVNMWLNMAENNLKNIPEGDEQAKVTIVELPVLDTNQPQLPQSAPATTNMSSSMSAADSKPASNTTAKAAQIQQTPADKIRHEWYQNSDNVYFTLLAKGVPKELAQIDITEDSLAISFPIRDTGATYDFTLDPLFASVIPDKCISRVLTTKIEIVLVKAVPGQKWSSLESKQPRTGKTAASSNAQDSESVPIKRAVFTDSRPQGPAYPTSSKTGPKDWDKITKDLRKTDGPVKEGEVGDDDDDDEGGGDAANHFFKKLFKGASPEVQRAMMKSYTESNGTALSTNWQEVSKSKVETVPPDGMEARKW